MNAVETVPRRASIDLGLLGLAVACAVGIITRFWQLPAASLYSDEAYTFAASSLSPPALLHTLTALDFHPPLFYLATHFLMQWLHWPLWDYRYLSAPLGIVTIIATWGACRRMFGPVAASLAAVLVALAPALILYDRIYRMYSVLAALATVSWWLLIEVEHASGSKRFVLWIAYTAVGVALVYTHYLGLLVLACQGLYALSRFPRLNVVLASCAVSALAFAPWVSHALAQLPRGGMILSRPGLDAGLAASIRDAFAAGAPDGLWSIPGASIITAIVVTVIVVAGMWFGRRTALPFWLATFVLAVFASIAFDKNLAYFGRYLLIDIPPVAIAFGLVISSLIPRHGFFALLASAAVVTTCAIFASNVLFDPYYQFPDWYAVNAVVLRNEQPGDAIVLDAGYEYLVVNGYSAFRGRTVLSFMSPMDFPHILSWIRAHPTRRIWYIENQNFYWDPTLRIKGDLALRPVVLERRFPRQAAVNDVTLVLFGAVPIHKT